MKLAKFNLSEKYRRENENYTGQMDLELSITFEDVDKATLFQSELVDLIRNFNEVNKNANKNSNEN